jgi:hypothetical protein
MGHAGWKTLWERAMPAIPINSDKNGSQNQSQTAI